MTPSKEVAYLGPRNVKALALVAAGLNGQAAMDAVEMGFNDLKLLGVEISERQLGQMMEGLGFDAIEPSITPGSIATPIQFLQTWLPGFVYMITAARKIDELIGISTVGAWEDEEVVQGILELLGTSVPYGDVTNIPLSSWNNSYERRTVVRFEEGMMVGRLEEARTARANINSADTKRRAATVALEIQRNRIGFFGYNAGANRTYGFLNDPGLPAYTNVAAGVGGLPWSTKTFLEITADIRTMLALLRTQSQDTIDPETTQITLALASNVVDYLTVTSVYGNSVRDWLTETYPKVRVVSAPELNGANGGANVAYMYAESLDDGSTDDGRVITQIVPTKFKVLGVEQKAKGYIEDFSNATAGVLVKRPYAIVRKSGL